VIAVIDYGAGNLRSISNGLKKVGGKVEVVDDPAGLKKANAIVLPGVGSFGDAMEKLVKFKPAIIEAVESGKPFLGLCLGEQVIFESSEESPGVEGLGIFKGECKRFNGALKVPHMGWNTIRKVREIPLLDGIEDGEYFYFVHSYYVVPNDLGVVAAETEYGVNFPSVVSAKNVFATQFHPEKSADRGLAILRNFLEITRR
jgi:imidazole glycerol-phosphate synthase subunit HisH